MEHFNRFCRTSH